MNELLLSMKKYVEDDEEILAFVVGIFENDDFTLMLSTWDFCCHY